MLAKEKVDWFTPEAGFQGSQETSGIELWPRIKSIAFVGNGLLGVVPDVDQLLNILIIEISFAVLVLLTKLVIVCCLASVSRPPELRTKAPE